MCHWTSEQVFTCHLAASAFTGFVNQKQIAKTRPGFRLKELKVFISRTTLSGMSFEDDFVSTEKKNEQQARNDIKKCEN
jgi:hypothetical protein